MRLQPSPFSLLPSSHCSLACRVLSPQLPPVGSGVPASGRLELFTLRLMPPPAPESPPGPPAFPPPPLPPLPPSAVLTTLALLQATGITTATAQSASKAACRAECR